MSVSSEDLAAARAEHAGSARPTGRVADGSRGEGGPSRGSSLRGTLTRARLDHDGVESVAPTGHVVTATLGVAPPARRRRAAPPRPAWNFVLQLVAVAVGAGLAGGAFSVAFAPAVLVVPVGLTAALAVVVSAVLCVSARPPWGISLLLGALGFAAWASLLVFRGLVPGALYRAVVDGWAQIVSSTLPVDPEPAVLLWPVMCTWIAAYLAAELVHRTRSTAAPAAPIFLLLTVALSFGGDGGASAPGSLTMAAVLTMAGLLVLLRARVAGTGERSGSSATTTPRRLLVGLPVVVVAAAVGVVLGPRLPFAESRPPFQLRDHHDEPHQPRTALNPMALLAAGQRDAAAEAAGAGPSRVLFTVDASAPVDRYRWVVLDRYDGQQWLPTGAFTRAGVSLPPAPTGAAPAQAVRSVQQRIQVSDLDGIWLPAADRPVAVSKGDYLFDPVTGVLAKGSGRVDGLSYEVMSDVPVAPDASTLRGARSVQGPDAAPFLDLPPDLPPEITEATFEATSGSQFNFQQAYDLQRYLQQNYQLIPGDQARAGHSARALADFLTRDEAKAGTSEQFAAAYAVMARKLGLPTRVVVGFRGDRRSGQQTVRSSDLLAWPEVLFDGIGWIPFTPTPEVGAAAPVAPTTTPPASEDPGPDLSGAIAQAGGRQLEPGETVAPPPALPPPEPGLLDRLVQWALLGAVTVALVVAALAVWVVAVRRHRRRSRRRAPTPAAQVVGAWDEALDRLAESGLVRTRSLTAGEVCRAGADRLGPDVAAPLPALARLANAARYGSSTPGDGEVAEAWHLTEQFASGRRAALPWRQRITSSLDPRPLVLEHR